MNIRYAEIRDVDFLEKSLKEICAFHSEGRPDLFNKGGVKYNEEQVAELIKTNIVLVAEDAGELCGYLVAKRREYSGAAQMREHISLYVDDLYVVPEKRKLGVGKLLMEKSFEIARECGCYNVILNVWDFPGSSIGFYESLGMKPMSHMMETIL